MIGTRKLENKTWDCVERNHASLPQRRRYDDKYSSIVSLNWDSIRRLMEQFFKWRMGELIRRKILKLEEGIHVFNHLKHVISNPYKDESHLYRKYNHTAVRRNFVDSPRRPNLFYKIYRETANLRIKSGEGGRGGDIKDIKDKGYIVCFRNIFTWKITSVSYIKDFEFRCIEDNHSKNESIMLSRERIKNWALNKHQYR